MRRSRMPAVLEEQFARERQILAWLQHRNIAQLFDGGVTPEGQSYFVIELVSGRSITHYAREEALPLPRGRQDAAAGRRLHSAQHSRSRWPPLQVMP